MMMMMMMMMMSRPVARIDWGGAGPQKLDLLDPKSGLFEPHPLNPTTKIPFLAHFLAKSGAFGRLGVRLTPWLRACGSDANCLKNSKIALVGS